MSQKPHDEVLFLNFFYHIFYWHKQQAIIQKF